MNYLGYILAAYMISFFIIGWMFVSSLKKYRVAQRELARSRTRNNPVQ